MLTIRAEQMVVLEQSLQQPLSLKMGLVLKERHPIAFQYYTDSQMQTWVTRQIDYLESFNITGQKAAEDIIDLLALCGEKFERCSSRKWALKILEKHQDNEEIRALKLQRTCEKYFKST